MTPGRSLRSQHAPLESAVFAPSTENCSGGLLTRGVVVACAPCAELRLFEQDCSGSPNRASE
eukprot:5594893-Prymnesium_polylepis.2